MVFGSSVLKTKFTNHKHFTSLLYKDAPDALGQTPARGSPRGAGHRPAPASQHHAESQRRLVPDSGHCPGRRVTSAPRRGPQTARTYRSSVPRVGHGQPIKSHESSVSQRQRCCEKGRRCATGGEGLHAVPRALAPGSQLRLWSPAPERGPAPAGVKPRPSRL